MPTPIWGDETGHIEFGSLGSSGRLGKGISEIASEQVLGVVRRALSSGRRFRNRRPFTLALTFIAPLALANLLALITVVSLASLTIFTGARAHR